MARFIKDITKTAGKAPGSLIHVGEQKMDKPTIRIIDYDQDKLMEKELHNIDEAQEYLDKKSVSWINIDGIHDRELVKRTGEIFSIDSLLLEDIMNTDQNPKYFSDDNNDAFILKMLKYDPAGNKTTAEQISIIIGRNFILTLQEHTGDVFEPVRNRIRNQTGRVRLNNNDYLAYALMDVIADNYLTIIELLGKKIEDLESVIFENHDKKIAVEIARNKIELSFLRKNIRPAREAIQALIKNEKSFFSKETLAYVDDLKESVTHASDSIELYNTLVIDQLNTHNTLVNNRMNQVMKVLTIFASLFIPMTFVAGIYGMNFRYMPELEMKYGYLFFWILIIFIGIALLIFFKKKKWL